jgi:hypothetical protein
MSFSKVRTRVTQAVGPIRHTHVTQSPKSHPRQGDCEMVVFLGRSRIHPDFRASRNESKIPYQIQGEYAFRAHSDFIPTGLRKGTESVELYSEWNLEFLT